MSADIGKDHIVLEKKKRSALTKAVKTVKVKGKAVKSKETSAKGIIMLNHVPHGFYENEMRSYFSQFGKVLRIRLARSKKTGRSRGYAFVEFAVAEVAQIAAESMNNYLMFERLIKCEVVSSDINPRKIFRLKNIQEKCYPKLRTREFNRRKESAILTEDESEDVMIQRVAKLGEQNNKFAEMGIDYSFPIPGCSFIKTGEIHDEQTSTPGQKLTPEQKKNTPKQNLTPRQKKSTNRLTPPKERSTPKQKVTPDQKKFTPKLKLTPQQKKPTPKQLTPGKGKTTTTEQKSTPKEEKQKLTPQRQSTPTQKITPGQPKFTPKQIVSSMEEGITVHGNEMGNKMSPKKSPTELKYTKTSADDELSHNEELLSKGRKRKASTMPKFSPKLLRSKNTTAVDNKVELATNDSFDGESSKMSLQNTSKQQKNIVIHGKKKTPEKTKFSPKLLRSRKSQGPNIPDKHVKNTTGRKEKPDLPKVSPKLLRSKKSDASCLTPLAGKSTPAKQKKGGTKSVF